jgi:Icc-related predicted phosphoesterase
MKVLSLSDKAVPFIYSPLVRSRCKDAHLILGCGDLSYEYLEYIFNALDAPLFFVRGNHDQRVEYTSGGERTYPHGGIDLHRRTFSSDGLLLAGIEGSLRYREGDFQYSQFEMWLNVISLVPAFLRNRLSCGRFLDIFIAHAPPTGIHSCDDLPHRGIDAFFWLIETFHPRYFFHGHVHLYRPDTPWLTVHGKTSVINTYGYRELDLNLLDGK